MTQAVTHVLITVILISLFRDVVFRKQRKEKFPLHYVLIGGIASLIPDLDVAVYYILSFFGFSLSSIHRTFSHNVFVVLLFILIGILVLILGFHNKKLGKHHLRLDWVFYVMAFGVFTHLLLDYFVAGRIMPFYPFYDYSMGFNLVRFLPSAWRESFIPSLDAVLLVLWLIYIEIKHKISDFI